MTPTSLNVDLGLRSGRARLALSDYRFETDLDAAVRMENPAIMRQATRVAGSYIRLSDARLLREGQRDESGWSASLRLKEGDFHLLAAEARADGDKCDRCWIHDPTVGEDDEHPTVCLRCRTHLAEIGTAMIDV